MSGDISELEKSIGYSFKNKAILIEALTHKSYHHENPEKAISHNERLEFLGDSVLGLAVVHYLYNLPSLCTESVMSKLKSHAVKAGVLFEIAQGISLGNYLRVGRGEEATGGRYKKSLISNALEAVIGAIYADGGIEQAQKAVFRLFREKVDSLIESGDFYDYKTELQELTQMKLNSLPEYRIVKEEGEAHKKVFTVEVWLNRKCYGKGFGKSKKEAEAISAKQALETLR
ncbi:MAG: ribonuclease III [Nitrospirae bacterium]|nr:ribonuclease III [Nitrospirota bacterium]